MFESVPPGFFVFLPFASSLTQGWAGILGSLIAQDHLEMKLGRNRRVSSLCCSWRCFSNEIWGNKGQRVQNKCLKSDFAYAFLPILAVCLWSFWTANDTQDWGIVQDCLVSREILGARVSLAFTAFLDWTTCLFHTTPYPLAPLVFQGPSAKKHSIFLDPSIWIPGVFSFSVFILFHFIFWN